MTINKKIREQVYNKYQGHCAYCGEEILIKNMQVDHIFPKHKEHWTTHEGMKHHPELYGEIPNHINELNNLNPSCRVCNLWKKTFDIKEFRYEISEQLNRLQKRSANFRLAKKYGLIEEHTTPVLFYFEKVNQITNY